MTVGELLKHVKASWAYLSSPLRILLVMNSASERVVVTNRLLPLSIPDSENTLFLQSLHPPAMICKVIDVLNGSQYWNTVC